MPLVDPKIIEFIKEHHVLTLATSAANIPWCANCFYAFIEDEMSLVVSSDLSTRHGGEALANSAVSGSIVLETSVVGKIQGIQFSANMVIPSPEMSPKVNKQYLLRFPFAILKDTHLWIIELSLIKMTDNRLGFGKKIVWERNAMNNNYFQ